MKFFKLLRFRLKRYLKNPVLILTLIVFLIIFGAIVNRAKTDQKEVFVLPIGVVDLDRTQYSQLIIQRVAKKDTVHITTFSQEEALKQVSTGKLEAVYILKEGLMDKVLDGDIDKVIEIVKSPVSLSAEIIGELFAAELMRLSSNVDAAHAVVWEYGDGIANKEKLWKQAWEQTDAYWEPHPVIAIDYKSTRERQLKSNSKEDVEKIKSNIYEIITITLIIFSVLIGCGTLLHEKNNGTIKRVITSGTPLWVYVLSSVVTIIIIHTIGLIAITALTGSLSLEIGGFIKQMLLYISYMIWAGAMGIMVIALASTMQQLLLIIPLVTLFNGFFAYWVMQGNDIFGMSIAILALYSCLILLLAIRILYANITRY